MGRGRGVGPSGSTAGSIGLNLFRGELRVPPGADPPLKHTLMEALSSLIHLEDRALNHAKNRPDWGGPGDLNYLR
ncbi:hypothetical protein GCM10008960_02510 [Deinococcus sedimenti]|uniref:Uncharacterized protein n=1 Tax=Deinococcus sedimenti TaxID=1867090 RepID=A0ABQ2S2A7_9DEIO|nr:hypothetical protein GCM10008960_02510 [Deinococcus sedimenti]